MKNNESQYHNGQKNSPYCGKKFSILGDSISTLDGYNPKGYNVFYKWEVAARAGVSKVEDTWWGKVIDTLGGELLVNNSWSGSRVTKFPGAEELFPSGCSDERTGGLHTDSAKPDVIIIYMGTNDWGFNVPVEPQFRQAYGEMLRKIKKNYPLAEVWCCTMPMSYVLYDLDAMFTKNSKGIHMEDYNQVIRDAAKQWSCKLMDLQYGGKFYESMDGTHPSAIGMQDIASMVMKFIMKEVNTVEKVIIEPERTEVLYTDTASLFIPDLNKTINFKQKEIWVGRQQECELHFENQNIELRHALFLFDEDRWYIMDNGSSKGTKLNNVPLEKGKAYRLYVNDVIDFADSQTIIFNR